MTETPIPDADLMAVSADVLDAIDPTQPEATRHAAIERAAKKEPEFALWITTELLVMLIAQQPLDSARVMAFMRQRLASVFEDAA